uniref:Putative glycoprotein n=1 Tax=Sorghum bicolor TaxID=4558 RepID=O24344_SORBI|nr:putative glycoprotein [Sorghum bicolor]
MASEVEDARRPPGAPLVANGAADVRRRRDQAKAILSKQAVKIATKAEQHDSFIFKVTHLLGVLDLGDFAISWVPDHRMCHMCTAYSISYSFRSAGFTTATRNGLTISGLLLLCQHLSPCNELPLCFRRMKRLVSGTWFLTSALQEGLADLDLGLELVLPLLVRPMPVHLTNLLVSYTSLAWDWYIYYTIRLSESTNISCLAPHARRKEIEQHNPTELDTTKCARMKKVHWVPPPSTLPKERNPGVRKLKPDVRLDFAGYWCQPLFLLSVLCVVFLYSAQVVISISLGVMIMGLGNRCVPMLVRLGPR